MTISTFDVLKVTANYIYRTSELNQSVYGCRITDLAGSTQAQVRDSIARWMETIYIPQSNRFNGDYVPRDINIFNNTTGNPEPDALWPTWVGGTSTGESIPEGCCAFGSAITGVARRQGRKYWPPPSETHQNAGVVSIAAQVDYNLALAAWIGLYTDAVTGVVLEPGVIPTNNPLILTPFTIGTFNSRIAYQRRRKVGVGQ